MNAYAPEIEWKMKKLFDSLSEADRRRYAAVEASKLGHGGIEYIAKRLECDPKTIRRGLEELEEGADLDTSRVRKKGGGRKKLIEISDTLEANFFKVLEDHTAGDPMRADVKWTNLSRRQIADRLTAMGTPVSRHLVSLLLRKHRFRRRKAVKKKTMGPRNPNRNAQFENIGRLKKEFLQVGLPVISMDTKKKELLGNFSRDGKIDTQGTIETNDHDFKSAGVGTVIPHGLYDVGKNKGFVHLNTSHDTSELACDSIAAWWDQQGQADYPQAKKLLVLCDGGGSNSAAMYLFKEDLQKLANRLGIEIRVAHYPPYCSKYNPIEHRLFPHLTRACRGVIFHTLETVRYYRAKAATATGLTVKVGILDRAYETGRKYTKGFKKTMKIVFDKILPKWNYRAVPALA
jgi:Rhodopirellula transposase DDE domain